MQRSKALLAASLASLVTFAMGCAKRPAFDEQVRALAKLPAASASQNTELREQLAILRQQQGGPDQLNPAGFTTPADQNAAAQLGEVFSDMFRKQIGPKLEELVDSGELSPTLLETHAPSLRKLEQAASCSVCRFSIDSTVGYFAAMRYLDDVALASRFELLRSRQAAAEGDGAAAMSAWRRGMRWCHWLARVPRVSSRVQAATLRAELLNELALQLDQRIYGRYEAEQVYGLLRDQLTDWPSDRQMLRGDRAMVVHAYEAIRAGFLNKMVTLDERKRLRSAGVYEQLVNPNPKLIDRDQANYLRAIALLLDAADRPFHERERTQWQAETAARSAPNLAAHTMFLQEIADAQLLAARDRSRCEVWCLALAASSDLVTPPFRTNPVNGEQYEAVVESSRVIVRTFDSGVGVAVCPRFVEAEALSQSPIISGRQR